MPDPYAVGDVVVVEVSRILPFGLIVKLPGGGEGLIRRRELAWSAAQETDWQNHYRCGQKLDAMVLHERRQFLELSLRLLERDPWDDLAERYWLGRWTEGTVTGIVSYGVFIQLEPGVTGLLHRSNLPHDILLEEHFWAGDSVFVAVGQIDGERRRIGLTMAGIRNERWHGRGLSTQADNHELGNQAYNEPPAHEQTATLDGATISPPLPLTLAAKKSPIHLLVVEDDIAQREALCRWLTDVGQRVSEADDAETAAELIAAAPPDVLLTDMQLAGEQNGIELIQDVLALPEKIACVLMSDWGNLYQHWELLAGMRDGGVDIIPKPLRPDDLLDLLAGVGERPLNEVTVEHAVDEMVQIESPERASAGPLSANLKSQLRRLRKRTGAHKVVLFELEPNRRQIGIVAEYGGNATHRAFLPDLIHSPVRDVTEDGHAVVIQDMAKVGRYARKLRPAIDCEACMGYPIEGLGNALYALFVFFKASKSITPLVKEHVEASTLAIGALLKESHLVTHSADLQRVALLGHMTQMLVHEINHHLTPIAMAVSSLREHCVAVQRALDAPNPDHDPTQMANEIGEAIGILRLLDNNVQGLTDKSRLFGRMMVHDALEVNRVDRIIERSLDLVRDQAADAHITLTYAPPDHLLFTRLRATQVQQVVLNTLLNAIQQIERLRPDGGGRVDIRVAAVAPEREPVIQIQIEDDGPGIHRRLWERVFELGFTTRVGEGSGLGLFLSRQLLADVGGSIRVAESHIQWGTVMEIRLPISLTETSAA